MFWSRFHYWYDTSIIDVSQYRVLVTQWRTDNVLSAGAATRAGGQLDPKLMYARET
jgi:hypothetical protein